jgi:hypothetical protein
MRGGEEIILVQKQRSNGLVRRIISAGFTVAVVLSLSSLALATVTRTYTMDTNKSQLVTPNPLGTQIDPITGTGETPVWIDGSLASPPVDYGGDEAQTTLNQIVIRFQDDGAGNIVPGQIEVLRLDWYNNINGDNAYFLLRGMNDTTLAGAVGTLGAGGTVESWTSDGSGLLHNEIYCENIAPAALCGGLGLPGSGETSVAHEIQSFPIAVTDAGLGSSPMVFSDDYKKVSLEITLDPAAPFGGRIYVDVEAGLSSLPASGPEGQIVLVVVLVGVALFSVFGLGRAARARS